VLSTEENCPGNAARVLSLKEEGLGLAILEAEDLVVTADVEFALFMIAISAIARPKLRSRRAHLARVNLLAAESVVVQPHFGGG
jgi:hypothetical protein